MTPTALLFGIIVGGLIVAGVISLVDSFRNMGDPNEMDEDDHSWG